MTAALHYPIACAAVSAAVAIATEDDTPVNDELRDYDHQLAAEIAAGGTEAVFALVLIASRLVHQLAAENNRDPLSYWQAITLTLAGETQDADRQARAERGQEAAWRAYAESHGLDPDTHVAHLRSRKRSCE